MPIGNMYFYSDTENSEGSKSVSHTSEGHTSSQGDGNSQLNDAALNIAIMEDADLKYINRLYAAKRVYKSMHQGGFRKKNLKLFRGSHGMKSTISEPVAHANIAQFPGYVAGHTQTAAASQEVLRSTRSCPPASFTSNQDRAQVQCWHCIGDHYKLGCPLFPRPTRRTRKIWHSGSTPMAISLQLSPMVA